MNFQGPEYNISVETTRAERFVQIQIGATITPALAEQLLMAIRGARDSLPGAEDPNRKKSINQIISDIEQVISQIRTTT